MNKDLSDILSNCRLNTRGNHYVADCPYCGKERHFYINIAKSYRKDSEGLYVNSWDCKSCSETGNIKKLLEQLGEEDFLEEELLNTAELTKKLDVAEAVVDDIDVADLILKDRRMPVGFIREYDNEYLQGRGFSDYHFREYTCGITNTLFRLKNYVLIGVEDDGKIKGYVGRSLLSKEEIDLINDRYREEGSKKKYLRWINSTRTDFGKLIMGYDEMRFGMNTAILVESMFNKVSVDNCFNLFNNDEVKCGVTFGKTVSPWQVKKLKMKGVENIIVIQDPDAVEDTKRQLKWMENEFKTVGVGFVSGDRDLNDLNDREINRVFNELTTPSQFYYGKVAKRKL